MDIPRSPGTGDHQNGDPSDPPMDPATDPPKQRLAGLKQWLVRGFKRACARWPVFDRFSRLYREQTLHSFANLKRFKSIPIKHWPKAGREVLKKSKHLRREQWLIIVINVVLILIILWVIMGWIMGAHHKGHVTPPVPVVIGHVKTAAFPVYLNALGAVTPERTITVKTQINGALLDVFFKEGQMVERGMLLAQIDPKPYEAQRVEFEGQLARDQAFLDNARLDLERYQVLYTEDSVSQQILDTQQSLVKQYEGT